MATIAEKEHDPEKGTDLSPKPTNVDVDVGTMLKHADRNNADEAMKAFLGHEGEVITMTPEMEKNLLRKVDWNLMPVSIFSFAF